MNKQTVEEAVIHGIQILEYNRENDRAVYRSGFYDGAAWQKEQGIDWISVDINPDVDWHEIEDGGSFKISKPLLLWKDGVRPVTGQFWMSLGSHPYYRLDAGNWVPTHWAYINLPKTD